MKTYQNNKQNRDSLRTRYPSDKRFQRVENGDNAEGDYLGAVRRILTSPYEFLSFKKF